MSFQDYFRDYRKTCINLIINIKIVQYNKFKNNKKYAYVNHITF